MIEDRNCMCLAHTHFRLQKFSALTKYTWMPITISLDLQKGLANACKQEFSGSILMGCYFHLKQAYYRKLKKFNRKKKLQFKLIKRFDLLNQKLIQTTIFEEFWKYFVKTWIGCYGAKLWNIHEIYEEEIICRTNNALERYN
ncbi:hypothetical protein HZS_2887 [Henneguya salminicola]|nr:hypothetical protein HZS_2887 [Henneguya salminicola]